MPRLNIAIVTGTRAEYGIYRPLLGALARSKKLRPHLVVTGMHLLKGFGLTVREIKRDGPPIAATVSMYRPGEPAADSLARATTGLAAAFRRLKIDLVMVLGDRLEMLAAANAALAGRIPLAHLHGGETAPGQWDEQIRHAITKIAHLHFPATLVAAGRIAQMGEPLASIFPVGACALDQAVQLLASLGPKQITEPPILLLHPTQPTGEAVRTHIVLSALEAALGRGAKLHVVGPNNDPGHPGTLQALRRAQRQKHLNIQLAMSLPQDAFWSLLYRSPFLIGNSSSGILEAATFATPVINVGPRQAGRERNPNVIDVPFETNAITQAIHTALHDRPYLRRVAFAKNLYGTGHAAGRITQILESLAATSRPITSLAKHFSDL